MRDCNFSRYIRNARGLHPDWRVYRIEAISGDRVKFTGDIARPTGEHDGRSEGSPIWFSPYKCRESMTVTFLEYRQLVETGRLESDHA